MTNSSTRAFKEALFCIGSNCGNREANVEAAIIWLSPMLTDFRHSMIYATPDCHGGQREYLNAVCVGLSSISATELESLCKKFEFLLGRDSNARAVGDVPVDIDLVMYDGVVLRKSDFYSEFFLRGYREINIRNEAYPLSSGD